MSTILIEQIKRAERDFRIYKKDASSTEEGLKKCISNIHYNKTYAGTFEQQRVKYLRFVTKKLLEEIEELKKTYKDIMDSEDFKHELILSIDWKKSYMWGHNPTASTNFGFQGSSIGGCGYCKLSTATAEAFNSHLPLLKLMYQKINKELKNPKKEYTEQNGITEKGLSYMLPSVLGYGSGRNMTPSFDGGVGISSHRDIIERLGLNFKHISTSSSDVIIISRKVA